MRLRLVTTGLLVPAALALAVPARAEPFSLPLQLSRFLTGAHSAKAPATESAPAPEKSATERKPVKRHAARHTAKHLAARHAKPAGSHPKHGAPEEPSPSVAAAPATESPAPSVAAATRSASPPPTETTAAPAPAPDPAPQFVNGIRVVSADEFNEIDAAADAPGEARVAAADQVNEIDLAAGPPIGTDGRNPDGAQPNERPSAELLTWPRLLAFAIGAPLLIGLFAWPLMAWRRPRERLGLR